MGEEVREFALHWNNFTDNIVNSFQLLHKQQELCDVTLAVEGKLLKAHKIVLSICSPYFQEMFNASTPNQPLFFVLHNMSAKLVVHLLEFMYLGTVNVQQCDLQAFMRIAESLKIKGLTSSSKVQAKKSPETESTAAVSAQSEKKTAQKRHLDVDETENVGDNSNNSECDYKNNIIEINDLSNDGDEDQLTEIIDDEQFAIPEVTMQDSTPKISSEEQKITAACHNNLKISSAHSLNSHPSIDYANESKKQAVFTENPPDSSGSNVTMLSSTSLLHGNCIFNRNNTVATQAGLKTYWLCKSYRMTMCKARCITHQGKVISATGIHNHLAHVSNKPTDLPLGHTPNLQVYNSSNQQQQQLAETSQLFINPSIAAVQPSPQSSHQTSYNFMPHYMTTQQPAIGGLSNSNNAAAVVDCFNIIDFNNHQANVKMEQI